MAKRRRRSYSDEYKRQAVDVVLSSGRSANSISKELGLDGSVLSRWVKERSTVAAGGSAAAPVSQAAVPSARFGTTDHGKRLPRSSRVRHAGLSICRFQREAICLDIQQSPAQDESALAVRIGCGLAGEREVQ